MEGICFVKLGGSLITDKSIPHTPRIDVISRLVDEIAQAKRIDTELKLVIGHGSGSFGHVPAHTYRTRSGVYTPNEWEGFIKVWKEARALNQIVMDTLEKAGVSTISFPPSSSVTAKDGKIKEWSLYPIQSALQNGITPVIYGDVIFDTIRGGTIFSTEELFLHLAGHLKPERILLAGLEEGVWADFPHRTCLLREITPKDFSSLSINVGASAGTDVTGGMMSKVKSMLSLVERKTVNQVFIFSAVKPDTLMNALLGENPGTILHA